MSYLIYFYGSMAFGLWHNLDFNSDKLELKFYFVKLCSFSFARLNDDSFFLFCRPYFAN